MSGWRRDHGRVTSSRADDRGDAATLRLADSDARWAAGVLTRAFRDDPVMRYLDGGDDRISAAAWRRFHRASVKYGLRYGLVDALATRDAVSVWLSPGNTDYSIWRMTRSGWILGALGLGPRAVWRFLRAYEPVEEAKKKAIGGRHWYLMYLAVEPSQQGTGRGRRLLDAGLRRVDADGLPCVLDTYNERNLAFYERSGFVVAAEGTIPGGPRFWTLRRNGQATAR